MGDSKRFWRESIGVVSPSSETLTGPTSAATGQVRPRPRAPEPAQVTGRTGPVSPAEPVEAVLARLPLGSVRFAEEAARLLWPSPSAAELRAVALVAETCQRPGPAGLRELMLRCVGLRMQAERLKNGPLPPGLDPTAAQARAAEWSRLARSVRDAAAAFGADSTVPCTAAALGLLPEPADVEAEAVIAVEAAALAGVSRGRPAPDEIAMLCGADEVRSLFERLRAPRPDAAEAIYLEVLALRSLALRSADGDARETLRRAFARVETRLDHAIAASHDLHRRDPERGERIAYWRRALLESRRRLDERATRRASATVAPEGEQGVVAGRDEAVLEKLRAVRERAAQGAADPGGAGPPDGADAGGTARGPSKTPRWLRWLFRGGSR